MEFRLKNELLKRISELNWSPLCKSILPIAFNDRHILVHIERESMDKIATYLLSVLNRINPIKKCLQVIVVTAKEFSPLVFKICKDLAMYLNLIIIKSNGDFRTNVKLYYNGAQIIIGHPEEIMTLLKCSSRPVSSEFKSIVIDNGEEVFLKGSAQFIDEIMSRLPPNRQILLFASEIRDYAAKFQQEYLQAAAEFDFLKNLIPDVNSDKIAHLAKEANYLDVGTVSPSTKKFKQDISSPTVTKSCENRNELTQEFTLETNQYLSFEDFGLNKDLLKRILELNLVPLCIEKTVLPIVLNNENIIVLIEKGNLDKVTTYLVSVLNQINPIKKTLQVIILTSKQLKQTVFELCKDLAIYLNLTIIKSERNFNTHVKLLHNGAQVFIGDPESIIKLLKNSSQPISCDFKSIVIDNGKDVFYDEIMSRLPPNRQIMLFTSEIHNSTIKFQKTYLKNAATFDFLNNLVPDATDKHKKTIDVVKPTNNLTEILPSRKPAEINEFEQDTPNSSLTAEEQIKNFGLNEELLKRISQLKLKPLCIHKMIIPIVLKNENVFVLIRRRNPDKVATYLLSVLNRINPIKNCLQVIIVTAIEFSHVVYKKCEDLAMYLNIIAMKSDGDFETNVKLLHNGAQVIIGDPESVKKLLKSSSRPVSFDFKSIVIDNGEEVFLKKSVRFINDIMNCLPPNRQILLFASDIHNSTIKFQKTYLNNAAKFDFLKDLISNVK